MGKSHDPRPGASRRSRGRSELRIGISGWRYPSWRGNFYPPGLRQREELAFAAERLNSIEINGSFYSLQRPELYSAWYRATPDEFVFSVKGSRFITHMKKLRDVEVALANFFASGVFRLGDKLGPFLWQFPENLGFDERFQAFLELLPKTSEEASELAARHDSRMHGRSETKLPGQRRLRHAMEVRSRSFCCPEFIALLRRYGVALVVAETAGRFPYLEDVTADFVYVRLHGDVELYTSGYSPEALARWARRIRAWHAGREPRGAITVSPKAARRRAKRDVYVYFDNDYKVRAPFDAMALAALLRRG